MLNPFKSKTLFLQPPSAFHALYPVSCNCLFILPITLWIENILLFLRLLLFWTRCPSNSRPITEFLFRSSWIFCSPFLFTFKSDFLNEEHVIVSDRLADLPVFMPAVSFGRGKIFDREILAPSAHSTLPPGGEIFLRLLEEVLPPAACFSIDTDICNSLPVSSGGSSLKFPWGRLRTSDGRKSSSEEKKHLD